MPRIPKKQELEALNQMEQILPLDLENIVKKAAAEYFGDGKILESAIGALIIGKLYGWQPLRVLHNASVYAKYQKILGVKFADVCPARGPLAGRSVGLQIDDSIANFWKIAKGEIKVPNKGLFDKS